MKIATRFGHVMHFAEGGGEQTRLINSLLALGVVTFALYFSVYQVAMHRALWTGVDVTNLVQPVWNTLHGNFLRSTILNPTGEHVQDFEDRVTESRLASHVQPLQLILLLPYAILPRTEVFMVLLAVGVALGAIPMYRIAARRVASPWVALAAAFVYLLWPTIQSSAAWEVHGVSFLPPLLLAALDAAENGKRGWWWLWILLAMGCREDIPFLAGWAMLWLAPKTELKTALAMFSVGLVWSLVGFFIIIPYFGGGGSPFIAYFLPPDTAFSSDSIFALLRQPSFWLAQLGHLLEYNVRLGVPLLFLYVLHIPSLLAMAPLLLLNGLGWHQAVRLPFFSHYSAPIAPWALVGAVMGAESLMRHLRRRRPALNWRGLIWASLLVTIAITNVKQGYLPTSLPASWPLAPRPLSVVEALLTTVPEQAALSSSMHLAPHMARRHTLRLFPDMRNADWMVLDLWNWADPYGHGVEVWHSIISDPKWETVAAQDGILVLRKGEGPPSDLLQGFVAEGVPSLEALGVRFGAEWKLLGAQVYELPFGHFVLCTDWALDGEGQEVRPVVTIDGEIRPLDSYVLFPSRYSTPGEFRDCTQLYTADQSRRTMLDLMLLDEDGVAMVPTIESALDWEGRATVKGAILRLEVSQQFIPRR